MRKRSIFLALGTALALVVLTAGLALASGRWDGHHAAGPATGHQVTTNSIQPTAQQPGGAVRSTGPRTAQDWCDQTGTHAQMATRTATGHPTCAAGTSNHRSGSVHHPQPTTRPTATTTAPSSSQSRSGSTSGSQWMDRYGSHDGRCWDDRH